MQHHQGKKGLPYYKETKKIVQEELVKLGRGEFIGEEALNDADHVYPYSVKCVSRLVVYEIEKAKFMRIVKENWQFRKLIIER